MGSNLRSTAIDWLVILENWAKNVGLKTQQTHHSQFAGQNMTFVHGKWEIKGGPGSYSYSSGHFYPHKNSATPMAWKFPTLKASKNNGLQW